MTDALKHCSVLKHESVQTSAKVRDEGKGSNGSVTDSESRASGIMQRVSLIFLCSAVVRLRTRIEMRILNLLDIIHICSINVSSVCRRQIRIKIKIVTQGRFH